MTVSRIAREGMNSRLGEARELLQRIRDDEAGDGDVRKPNALTSVLRGLLYVSMYGALEYAVTQGTQSFISFLCGLNVSTKHLEYSLNAIALDSQLHAAADAGAKKKWQSRREIFSEMASDSTCAIPDTVFGTYLHNVHPATVREIFACLGIDKPPTSISSDLGYFTEITEKRNAVAHGRELAFTAGAGLSISDAETRMAAAYRIGSHFLDAIEGHAENLGFIKAKHRSAYQINSV